MSFKAFAAPPGYAIWHTLKPLNLLFFVALFEILVFRFAVQNSGSQVLILNTIMAEIGLVASVAGVACAGAKLSVILYKFGSTVASARKDVVSVGHDIALFVRYSNKWVPY